MNLDVDLEKPVYREHNGVSYLGGLNKVRAITAFTSGLGTRFAVYPIDFIGIYAETTVLFAFQGAFDMDLGPLTLQAVGGLEGHF